MHPPAVSPTTPSPRAFAAPLAAAAFASVVLPSLLIYETTPAATFSNQVAALAGWGLLLAMVAAAGSATTNVKALLVPPVFLMVLAMPAIRLSTNAALGTVATLLAAGWAFALGMRSAGAQQTQIALLTAMVMAGALNGLVAFAQAFAPADWQTGWIAASPTSGRVGANLRQPNHLASLLLSALAALAFLQASLHTTRTTRARTVHAALVVLACGLTFAIVLTASRTGLVCLLVLAAWGAIAHRLPASTRISLLALPLVYVLSWWAIDLWSASHAYKFGGTAQLNATDISSSRFAIWSNTLELIKQNPWTGVGWGEFNFAWTLTPFPNRPVAFFDHTHNLPLQLWVELGIPLGTVVLAVLAWALWKAFDNTRKAPPDQAVMRSTAFMIVLMMGVHSMLEYPLWYAYFLLPTAFCWGLCLSDPNPPTPESAAPPRRANWPIAASLAMTVGALYAVWDYQRVVDIFVPPKNATSLADRIERGMHSTFFAHHAHYAAATTAQKPSEAMASFDEATHFLLDTRLMLAWAEALNESGQIEKAKYVAARLKEFRNPASQAFFAQCDEPRDADTPAPFQCSPPTQKFTFRDFR